MIFVNENKERIEIIVRVRLDLYGCEYRIDDICITPYRKKKSISLAAKIRDSYEYRILDKNARHEYIRNEYLKYCTEDQLWEAVQEEFQKMAPTKNNIIYRV